MPHFYAQISMHALHEYLKVFVPAVSSCNVHGILQVFRDFPAAVAMANHQDSHAASPLDRKHCVDGRLNHLDALLAGSQYKHILVGSGSVDHLLQVKEFVPRFPGLRRITIIHFFQQCLKLSKVKFLAHQQLSTVFQTLYSHSSMSRCICGWNAHLSLAERRRASILCIAITQGSGICDHFRTYIRV